MAAQEQACDAQVNQVMMFQHVHAYVTNRQMMH
jgi:hypothetical protein